MSIATQIERLQNAKESIKSSLIEQGISASEHNMDDFAEDILNIRTGITPTGRYTYPEGSLGDTTDITEYAEVNAENVYEHGWDDSKLSYEPVSAVLSNDGRLALENSYGNPIGPSKTFENSYNSAKAEYEPKTVFVETSGRISVRNEANETILNTSTTNSYEKGFSDGRSGYMPTPTATKSITANGTGIDVLNYAKVDVNVPTLKGHLKLLAYETRTGTRKLSETLSVYLSAGQHFLVPMFVQGTTSQTSANQGHTAYFGHVSSVSTGAAIVGQGPEMNSTNIGQTSTEYYCKINVKSSGYVTLTITQNVLSAHTSYGQGYFLYELI